MSGTVGGGGRAFGELAVEDGGFHRSYFLVRHRSKYLTDGMKRVIRVLREHLGGEQP